MMFYLESEENNMDKLEQAMQSEDFWVELADTSFGTVVLHGKNVNSTADNEYYEVSGEINTDGDFAITFFKTYEKMKKWFDEWQGEGFYNYLVELYEKQLDYQFKVEVKQMERLTGLDAYGDVISTEEYSILATRDITDKEKDQPGFFCTEQSFCYRKMPVVLLSGIRKAEYISMPDPTDPISPYRGCMNFAK